MQACMDCSDHLLWSWREWFWSVFGALDAFGFCTFIPLSSSCVMASLDGRFTTISRSVCCREQRTRPSPTVQHASETPYALSNKKSSLSMHVARWQMRYDEYFLFMPGYDALFIPLPHSHIIQDNRIQPRINFNIQYLSR